MKKIYCDRCGIEDGEVKVGGANFYAVDFPTPGKGYNRTDLSITKELCEPCTEELSKIISNFIVKQDANTKTEEPEAGKVSSAVIDPEFKTSRKI